MQKTKDLSITLNLGVLTLKMITKQQFKLLEIFSQNIFRQYSFKEISDYYGSKSNSIVPNYLKELAEKRIILKKKISNVGFYRLNLDNPLIYSYLYSINLERLDFEVLNIVRYFKEELNKAVSFYSLIIFGSYAIRKENKKSDLDIAIIVPRSNKKIEIAAERTKFKSVLKLDIHIIEENEFLDMLKEEQENLGKEIARKNCPVHNVEIFFSLVMRGMKSGFQF